MNLILYTEDDIVDDGTVLLRDRRRDHIIGVLKCEKGDAVRVGLINGGMGQGRIAGMTDGVVLEVSLDETLPPEPVIDLVLALPRPIMLQRIFFQAAAMGVGRIFLINANRVEKSFFQASLLKEEKYRPFLVRGLEQAMDTRVPEVSVHKRFRPFVEDFLPAVARDYACRLVAHPGSDPLPPMDGDAAAGRVLLAVGPEGGWVDFEVEKFQEQGFVPFGMGPRILRVDTAVVALMARVQLRL